MFFQIAVIIAAAVADSVTAFVKCHTRHQQKPLFGLTERTVLSGFHDSKASGFQLLQALYVIIMHDAVPVHSRSSNLLPVFPCLLHQKPGLHFPLCVHISQKNVCLPVSLQPREAVLNPKARFMQNFRSRVCPALFHLCSDLSFSVSFHTFPPGS